MIVTTITIYIMCCSNRVLLQICASYLQIDVDVQVVKYVVLLWRKAAYWADAFATGPIIDVSKGCLFPDDVTSNPFTIVAKFWNICGHFFSFYFRAWATPAQHPPR